MQGETKVTGAAAAAIAAAQPQQPMQTMDIPIPSGSTGQITRELAIKFNPTTPTYRCPECFRTDPPIYVLNIVKEMNGWSIPCYLLDLEVTKGQCSGESFYLHPWGLSPDSDN